MKNNIGLFLAKRAELDPDLEAFVGLESGQRLTYREFNERSCRTANALTGLGVGKGDRVALLMMNGAEYIESFFAIARIGAIVVPLNWRLVADELTFILSDSGATVLLFDGEFAEVVAALQGRPDATAVTTWVQAGDDQRADWASSYDELQQSASADAPETGGEDEDELYIMYTSGTTGLPKGAVHTHASAMWGALTIAATADMRYADRYMVTLPLFHVGALTPMLVNVYKGGTSVVMRAFDPVRAWQALEEEKIDNMLLVPAMLNFMLQVPDFDKYDRSRLRWCMSGAAPVPVNLIERCAELDIEIQQVYGMTESCGPACLLTSADSLRKAGSTGKAFFHTDVRVVDDKGDDVAPGEAGEVWIRGAHVMKEYWNRPEASEETLAGGWLHSGDIATIDDEGFIYIQDRMKDMIISGGENVYPAEIENVLLDCDGVADAAVIGQPSEKWGESPVAVLVGSAGPVDPGTVLEHCKTRLAAFKRPVAVEMVEEIPRNPSGKILKRILRERYPGPAPA
ncbi:MAG TPA: long-chain-fatty-acid--CoA ligase [Deltaproteobacteria bacterium]|nr:long-chain-fatty-acid--CoA ligase [Candidatus Binatota bacterium]HIL13644.1 long-chain-fatty-acid--CoA ligase [Deltaproteobacteria bacterium]